MYVLKSKQGRHIEHKSEKKVMDRHEVYIVNELDMQVFEQIKKGNSISESLETEHVENAF